MLQICHCFSSWHHFRCSALVVPRIIFSRSDRWGPLRRKWLWRSPANWRCSAPVKILKNVFWPTGIRGNMVPSDGSVPLSSIPACIIMYHCHGVIERKTWERGFKPLPWWKEHKQEIWNNIMACWLKSSLNLKFMFYIVVCIPATRSNLNPTALSSQTISEYLRFGKATSYAVHICRSTRGNHGNPPTRIEQCLKLSPPKHNSSINIKWGHLGSHRTQ